MIRSLIYSFTYLAPNALLIGAAVLPAFILLVYVYRRDRFEPEPIGLLLSLLLCGVAATILAVIAESVGSAALAFFLPGGENDPSYGIWMFFVIVALSEEGFKYLTLRLRTWRSPHFNCSFDGVVYAVFVSLGFALFENIGYVLMYFGVFMGAYYGMARRCENRGEYGMSSFLRFLAVLIPTLIHGLYDYIAMSESDSVSGTFVVFVLVIFVLAFTLIKRLSRKDEYIA